MRGFNALPPQRKFGLMVAVAAVIAIIIGSMMWAQAPDYRVLYGNLGDRDGGAGDDQLRSQRQMRELQPFHGQFESWRPTGSALSSRIGLIRLTLDPVEVN